MDLANSSDSRGSIRASVVATLNEHFAGHEDLSSALVDDITDVIVVAYAGQMMIWAGRDKPRRQDALAREFNLETYPAAQGLEPVKGLLKSQGVSNITLEAMGNLLTENLEDVVRKTWIVNQYRSGR